MLVFLGSTNWRETNVSVVDASDEAFVRLLQATAGELGATSIFSQLYVSAGDYNGDGRMDIAVGRPEFTRVNGQQDSDINNSRALLSKNTRGQVYVFYSIETRQTMNLQLSSAHLIFDGQVETSRLGSLPLTPMLDINNNGLSDRFSALRRRVEPSEVPAWKQVAHMIYGNDITVLPQTGYDILTNRTITGSGSFLVDTGIGRPINSLILI